MQRTLTGRLRAQVGGRVRLAGWLHHQRRLAGLTFVLLRDRAGLAQIVVEDPGRSTRSPGSCPRPCSRSRRRWPRARRRPEASSSAIRSSRSCRRLRRRAADRPPPAVLTEQLPTLLDHAAIALRHPQRRAFEFAAASAAGYRRRSTPRLHRDPDAEDRRHRDRERRERVRARLLRPPRLPRAEPAVLQAGDGRRLRARLRDRARVPRRAARHDAAPRRVRLARCRARLHRRPPRRHAGAARGSGRNDRGRRRRAADADGAPSSWNCPTCPGDPLSIHFAQHTRRHRRASAAPDRPRTSGASARSAEPSSCSSSAIRWRSGPSTPTRTRPARVLEQLRPALPRA